MKSPTSDEIYQEPMALTRLAGRASVKFYHPRDSIKIVASNPARGDAPLSLAEVCQASVPACRLSPLLFNGHLQTFWTAVRNQDVPIFYKRRLFEADDPAYAGTFAVDFVVETLERGDAALHPRTAYYANDSPDGPEASDDAKPMLVALHGLSGGSHEVYLRHVLAPLVNNGGGWEACVLNARGCALSPVTSKILFNARATWDVRQLVKWLRKRFPNRPLFAIGFSLGANILINYLGEEGPNCMLNAAVVCSNPWNLDVASVTLLGSWLGREVYSKVMAKNLRVLVNLHKDQVAQNAGIDLDRVFKTTYLHEFDREIQCPTWGYPTVGAYYRDASSVDSLLAVRIPLFALNAEDDPIAVKEAIPYDEFKQNPYTVLCTTTSGGHLGWFESDGGRWFVKPITAYLRQMATIVESRVSKPEAPPAELPNQKGQEVKLTHFDPMYRKLRSKL